MPRLNDSGTHESSLLSAKYANTLDRSDSGKASSSAIRASVDMTFNVCVSFNNRNSTKNGAGCIPRRDRDRVPADGKLFVHRCDRLQDAAGNLVRITLGIRT